jgi:hypothetical protein
MYCIKNWRKPRLAAWVAAMIGACILPTQAMDDVAPACKLLKHDPGFISIIAIVQGEGKQCLTEDLVQRRLINLDDGRPTGKPSRIVDFFKTSDVDLDLRGHLVTSEPFEDATGVALNNAKPHFDNEATRALLAAAAKTGGVNIIKENMRIPHDLTVRNGTIRTPGPRGVGVYLGFYKNYGLSTNFFEPAFAPLPEDDRPMSRQARGDPITFVDPWNYQPDTRFTLDNLNIKAGGRGVIMTGAGNVLRNSTIEVDSDTAVYLYGPGSVVEGNTFIIHQNPKYPYPAARPAALKLRDADGALIRNNRFIVKGGPFGMFKGQAEVAINLLESRDVVIENNVIEGAKGLVRQDEASSMIEQGNVFK